LGGGGWIGVGSKDEHKQLFSNPRVPSHVPLRALPPSRDVVARVRGECFPAVDDKAKLRKPHLDPTALVRGERERVDDGLARETDGVARVHLAKP
jgi:hypothetical protein